MVKREESLGVGPVFMQWMLGPALCFALIFDLRVELPLTPCEVTAALEPSPIPYRNGSAGSAARWPSYLAMVGQMRVLPIGGQLCS